MLTAFVGFALAAIVWGFLKAFGRGAGEDPVRANRVRGLLQIADEDQLAFDPGTEGGAAAAVGERSGVSFRFEGGTRGMAFDGDFVLVMPCASDERVVVAGHAATRMRARGATGLRVVAEVRA